MTYVVIGPLRVGAVFLNPKLCRSFLIFIRGESCQETSWIQDFEAEFPWKASLNILTWA